MLNINEKKLYKFIFILTCCLFFIPGIVLAEDPEQGEVIIQTDGTYSDHELIEACDVGSMVKLDIGSFDTAYINNNFDINSNIDGYIYFECGYTNDIKLAYYGINSTIYVSYENILNDDMLNALSTFDFTQENIIVSKYTTTDVATFTNSISNYNPVDYTYDLDGYYRIHSSGIIDYVSGSVSSNASPNATNRQIFYIKINGEVIYDGLPSYVTEPKYLFEDVASIYINPIFDSYSQSISSIDAPTYSIQLSNYNMTLNGQLHCEYFYSGTDLCAYYEFENEVEDSSGNAVTYPYATITLPSIFMTNTNPASQLGVDGYYHYTFHYDVLITFNDEYEGYLEFQNTGKFYINGSELRFTKTTTYRSDSPEFYYDLVLTDYSLKRKIDPIVNPVEDEQKDSVSKNDTQNAELDSVITEYNEIEGQFKDNLDTSLNDIDFSFDFGNITDFSTSANFVRTQFDNITDNPFGSLVGFSLAVGLALLIMGRRL